ncbi:MAG: M48 family metalloprotease [Candidatus Sulfotelmatobacter sp.]
MKASIRFLALLVIAAAAVCSAQDADDDAAPDAASDFGTTASLSLSFDKEGSVEVNLGLPEAPPSLDALHHTLAHALHCAGGKLDNSVGFENAFTSLPSTWTGAQRDRYLAAMAKLKQKNLTGKCTAVLARREGVLEGDFDYGPFAAELAREGVQQLDVLVHFPRTEYLDYTKTGLSRQFGKSGTSLTYEIPLNGNSGNNSSGKSSNQVLHLAYGFRRSDVERAFCILAGFLLLPLGVTLWMRRGALAAGLTDPIASRFRFFRTLNFLLTGSMLLWITSGLGSRQILRDWIEQLRIPGWEAVAADVLILVGPSFVVYFFCIAASYPVYAQVRSGGWNRREYLVHQLAVLGAWVVPLMLALAAMEILREHIEVAISLLIFGLVMLQVLLQLKLRVTKSYPQAVTTGELRDRILALAGRMGVQVSRIFVLPAGKGQIANAYAAKNKTVIFTDYLLEHLSKREVGATAAHELAHLRHRHPGKRGFAFMAAIFLPAYFPLLSSLLSGLIAFPFSLLASATGVKFQMQFFQALEWFEQWSQRDFVLIMLGLTGFYFLSRRFENQADETAVRVAGDPEAQITGLLKISRLNFMPIRWGKTSEGWLTHPSTVKRAERIAALGGLAPERLQQILQQYEAGTSSGEVAAAEDRYAVPAAGDAERLGAVARDRLMKRLRAWALLTLHVLPLTAVSLLILHRHLEGWAAAAAYATGVVVNAVLVILAGVWLGSMGRAGRKRRLLRRFANEHLPVGKDKDGDVLVGFAPEAYPRIYGAGDYHWDQGFLVLAQDRLQFVGEQTRFALSAGEVESIVLGPGGPSWWKFERIYVRWRENAKDSANSRNGVFNLYLLEPGSIWKVRAELRALCRRLQAWHQQPRQQPAVRPELANLQAPSLGEVSCLSPRKLGSAQVTLRVLGKLLFLALCAGILLHAEIWYLCGGVFVLRMFQSIPYWRYRDKQTSDPGPQTSDFGLRTSDLRPQTLDLRLQTPEPLQCVLLRSEVRHQRSGLTVFC